MHIPNQLKIILVVVGVLFLFGTFGFRVYENITTDNIGVVDQKSYVHFGDYLFEEAGVTRSGEFQGYGKFRRVEGTAVVYETELEGPILALQNFTVSPGPDMFVYLSVNRDIETKYDLSSTVSLGKLKNMNGGQFYVLPLDYKKYKSVVIWSRALGMPFAVAEFESSNNE